MDITSLSSITAESRNHLTTTEKYTHISTVKVLEMLQDYGWHPVTANQAKPRLKTREGFQRHAVKLENRHYNGLLDNIAAPQMLIKHAHDGTSALQLLTALHVYLCSNGLVRTSGTIDKLRVLHSNFSEEKLLSTLTEFINRLPGVAQQVKTFIDTPVSPEERELLAQTAIEMRFDPITNSHGVLTNIYPVRPAQILQRRRSGDSLENLWGTFNVIQENILERPVARAVGYSETSGRIRHTKIRPVKAIDANTKLNQALWAMTEKFANLKRGVVQ